MTYSCTPRAGHSSLVPVDAIAKRIALIRNQRVIIDADLRSMAYRPAPSTKRSSELSTNPQPRCDPGALIGLPYALGVMRYARHERRHWTGKSGRIRIDSY